LLINKFFARIIVILRMSLGDFDFAASTYLSVFDQKVFWFIFLISVVVTNIIFMNFIIAEVSSSY